MSEVDEGADQPAGAQEDSPPVAASGLDPSPAMQPSTVPADEDRQAIIATIQQALAEDLLPFDELESRFERIYAADTQADLQAVVADLPALRRPPPQSSKRHLAPNTSMKVIGETKIGGWIAVDGDLQAINLIGDTVIDLSSAEIPDDGVTIAATTLIGSVKIILPDGVRVQCQLTTLIGDDTERLSAPLAGRPTIRVKTFVAVGDAAVYSLSEVPIGPLRRLWAKLRNQDPKAQRPS